MVRKKTGLNSFDNEIEQIEREKEKSFNKLHEQALKMVRKDKIKAIINALTPDAECGVCGKDNCEFYLNNLLYKNGIDWKDKIESIEEAREALTDKWDELCDIEKEQPFPLKIKLTVEITPKDAIEKLYELVDTLNDILKTINKPKEA